MAILCSELKHIEGHTWIMTCLPPVSQFFSEATIANHCIYFYKISCKHRSLCIWKISGKKSFILKIRSPCNSSDLKINGYNNTGFLLYDLPHVALKKGFVPSGQCPLRSIRDWATSLAKAVHPVLAPWLPLPHLRQAVSTPPSAEGIICLLAATTSFFLALRTPITSDTSW